MNFAHDFRLEMLARFLSIKKKSFFLHNVISIKFKLEMLEIYQDVIVKFNHIILKMICSNPQLKFIRSATRLEPKW